MPSTSCRIRESEIEQDSVQSEDGTRISFIRRGAGPPILFVHGSLSNATDWFGVTNSLAHQFTCYMMDRRGRGGSDWGDANYSIQREYEDIAAVLGAIGPEAGLVGHSYGAIGALGAALQAPVRRIVLYEPPLPVGGLIAGQQLEPFARAVSEERYDDALEVGLRYFVRLPEDKIASMRSSSGWLRLCSLVPTWTRELQVMDGLSPQVDDYAAVAVPALLLLGTKTPDHPFRIATAALERTLPDVRSVALMGQRHMIMRSGQQLVARAIAQFFGDQAGPAI